MGAGLQGGAPRSSAALHRAPYLDELEHLRVATDALPGLVAYLGTDGRHLFVNRTHEVWFGRPAAELVGEPIEVLGPTLAAQFRVPLTQALAGKRCQFQVQTDLPGRGPRTLEVTLVPDLGPDGAVRGTVSLVADVTAPRDLEGQQEPTRARLEESAQHLIAELNAVNAETDLLYDLAGSMNRAESLEGLFAPAVAAMARRLGRIGLGRCALLLLDAAGVMRFEAWNGLSDRHRAAVDGQSPWAPDTPDPKVILVPDVRLSPDLAPHGELFEAEQIRALAFIPLVHAGHLLGSFVLYASQVRAFSPSDLRLTQSIADQVANALGRKRADAERERMIGELQRTVKSNELFAGILGHDLRNPLGAILMSATVLSRKTSDEGTARTVTRILSAGQRMNRMITQLLDFTRVRASGSLPIEPSWTDVASIFQQAIDELLLGGAQTGPRPVLERQGDSRGWWDPDRLAQLASNLMSNAIRHGTTERPVRVSIRADGPEGQVIIAVRNEGTIPPEILPMIFDPFRRGELRERRSGGLGLGLYITRAIVAAHRGNLDVTCSDDETVFTVELPRGGDGDSGGEVPAMARRSGLPSQAAVSSVTDGRSTRADEPSVG